MGIAERFESFSAKGKAQAISIVCAVCGVLMGFVIYIVFAHTFEQGQKWTRLLALAIGLAVAMGVAKLGEWLWETIATGETQTYHSGKKAFSTAIFLVIVFELCASTVEDFAKIAVGDFAALRQISSRVAGYNETKVDISAENTDLHKVLEALREHLRAKGMPDLTTGIADPSPMGRVIQTMGSTERIIVFAPEFQPSQDETSGLWAKPDFFGYGSTGGSGAKKPVRVVVSENCPRGGVPLEVMQSRPDFLLTDDERVARTKAKSELVAKTNAHNAACLDALRKLDDTARLPWLAQALDSILTRYDFYDAASFPFDTSTPTALYQALDVQAGLCRDIEKLVLPPLILESGWNPLLHANGLSTNAPSGCHDRFRLYKKVSEARPGLVSQTQIVAWNRRLLAHVFPTAIHPPPVYWTAFVVLIFVWCAAAIALGWFLTGSVFAASVTGPMTRRLWPAIMAASQALLWAALAMGSAVVVIRVTQYAFDLMFGDVPKLMELPGIVNVLNFIPWAVGVVEGLDIFGWHIPGWIILPIVVGTLWWMASDNGPDEDLGKFAGWALFGLLVLSVLPVLPGTIGLMLVVAITWVVPAFGLALLLPYLEPGAKMPRIWGLFALGASAVLGVWVLLRLGQSDVLSDFILIVTALTLLATGLAVFREVAVRDLWPLLTITVAFCLVGGTALWQDATFKGALNALHPLMERTPSPSDFVTSTANYVLFGESGTQRAPTLVPDDSGVIEAAQLELALVGSLGFWLTIALLAAWSLRRKEEGQAAKQAETTAPLATDVAHG